MERRPRRRLRWRQAAGGAAAAEQSSGGGRPQVEHPLQVVIELGCGFAYIIFAVVVSPLVRLVEPQIRVLLIWN